MPYKRFSRAAQAFAIPQNHAVFADINFFDTHACARQLSIVSGWTVIRPDPEEPVSIHDCLLIS
jgi:hypothetical protein